MNKVFLTAEWRKLAMANYEVDPARLAFYLPAHTELDVWHGACYVSLIGFMFINTRLKGIRIPFHSTFEEVNLRFYVRHKDPLTQEWRRGVVFVKEIVPKPALTFVANTIYHEKYQTLPMKHAWQVSESSLFAEYSWKSGEWNSFSVTCDNKPMEIKEGSEEEFITEHYWGYTKISDTKTSAYNVEHPRWQTYEVKDYAIQVNFGKVYGPTFSFLQNQKPKSILLAEGSEITVRAGNLV